MVFFFSHMKFVANRSVFCDKIRYDVCLMFFRPQDIVVGGLIFYHGFFLSSSFFAA